MMVYDLKGWEDAIAEGDPLAGFLLKAKRKWWIAILSFVAGVLVGAFKSEAIDLVKGLFHVKPAAKQAREKPAPPKAELPKPVDYSGMADEPRAKKAPDRKAARDAGKD
jgi:hypothetical protein